MCSFNSRVIYFFLTIAYIGKRVKTKNKTTANEMLTADCKEKQILAKNFRTFYRRLRFLTFVKSGLWNNEAPYFCEKKKKRKSCKGDS